MREGNLEAPTRHPIDWKSPEFSDEGKLFAEIERVFDICHGCRRCVSLCQSFPNLFDLVDATADGEVHGVAKADYWQVVDQCYLCDLCYMTKCPYTPPHPWNLDFPHLMLRAKAYKFSDGGVKKSEQLLASTDVHGQFAGIPVVVELVNKVNGTRAMRSLMNRELGVHPQAWMPTLAEQRFRWGKALAMDDVVQTIWADLFGGIDFLGKPFPDDPLPVASCWLTLACLLAAALWVLHRKVRACEVSR